MISENSNISLRHLRAIHTIWQQGSFSRAADLLGVVPSALSETVRQIEELAGAPLFSRSSRPVQPTPLGQAFLEETAPLLTGVHQALGRLQRRGHLLEGRLAIGASPSAISDPIAPALAAFHQAHPEISVTLHDDIAEALALGVVSGKLDLALAGRARESLDLTQDLIGCDPIVLACRADDPLCQAGEVALDQIDPARLIHLDRATGTSELIATAPELGERFRTGPLNAHSTIAQLCLIRAGIGRALMPLNALRLFNDPAIDHARIADLALERRLYLLRPRHRPQSHVAQRFVDCLRAVLAQPGTSKT